jgi:metal-responsive CopG/Arc/MetJ family transcriptional regulator
MANIKVVLNSTLLRATDAAAKHGKMNRSALIREALRVFLRRLETRERESRDRHGYQQHPAALREVADWEQVAAWPEP